MQVPPPEQLLTQLSKHSRVGQLIDRLDAAPTRTPPVFVVGGVVRDLLTGRESSDVDVVVEGPVSPVAELMEGPVRPHDRFGTVTVELGGMRFDLAEARSERYPRPGALPEVTPARIEDDLDRRDFTVNALAVGLTGTRRGELISFPGALDDLARRCLSVLHERSFSDDPTRLLRLARYRGRLGFAIATRTSELAAAAVAERALETVSGTRIGNELRLLVREPDPVAALDAMRELALDRALDPAFGLGPPAGAGVRVLRDALVMLPADGRSDLLSLAAAARAVPPERLRELLDRLAFAAAERDLMIDSAAGAERLARRLARAARPSEIAEAIDGSSTESIALAGALTSGTARRNALRWLDSLRSLELAITGHDLIAAGLQAGPAIGHGLRAARAALLDGAAPDRERQLAIALAAARNL